MNKARRLLEECDQLIDLLITIQWEKIQESKSEIRKRYEESRKCGCFEISESGLSIKKILNVDKKNGYEIRKELINGKQFGGVEDYEMESAYANSGCYIGNEKTAKFLINKMGISPESRWTVESNVCNIGFNETENKWYGWSHRAIFGFKIGDKIFTERCNGCTEKTKFSEHGSKTIKTMDDARKAAINFANYVA